MSKIIKILSFCLLYIYGVTANPIILVSRNIKDFGQSRNDMEMEAIADYLTHADIIAIQEMVAKHPGGAKAVARLADILNRKGSKWDYSVSDPTNGTSPQKSERYAFLCKPSKVAITGGIPGLLDELDFNVEREPYLIQFKAGRKVLSILSYHACTHDETYPERAEVMTFAS